MLVWFVECTLFSLVLNSGSETAASTSFYDPDICRSLDTVPKPIIQEMYQRQPVFTVVMDDDPSMRCKLDSICTTFFPAVNQVNTFVKYDYNTYTDGSSEITVTVVTDGDLGETKRANTDFTITQRVFSQLDEDTYVLCEILEFGEPTRHNVFAISFGAPNRNLIPQSEQVINSYNLAPQGLYVLPYRLPPKCVTQQVCTNPNPLVHPSYCCVTGRG